MSTVAEETRTMRQASGVRTVTHEELEALKNSTPTSRTQGDVYANPPDGYQIALGQKSTQTPSVRPPHSTHPTPGRKVTTAPDGYAIAIAKRKLEEETHVHE